MEKIATKKRKAEVLSFRTDLKTKEKVDKVAQFKNLSRAEYLEKLVVADTAKMEKKFNEGNLA